MEVQSNFMEALEALLSKRSSQAPARWAPPAPKRKSYPKGGDDEKGGEGPKG